MGRKDSALPPKLPLSEITASRRWYDKGYRPFSSSLTAPKVERFNLSPIHTSHRLSAEIHKSSLLLPLFKYNVCIIIYTVKAFFNSNATVGGRFCFCRRAEGRKCGMVCGGNLQGYISCDIAVLPCSIFLLSVPAEISYRSVNCFQVAVVWGWPAQGCSDEKMCTIILFNVSDMLTKLHYGIQKGLPGYSLKSFILAERERFELSERVNVHTISSRAP